MFPINSSAEPEKEIESLESIRATKVLAKRQIYLNDELSNQARLRLKVLIMKPKRVPVKV